MVIRIYCFFCGIEQLDRPHLRGRPIGVTNGQRGSCIITCSYEARSYGIKTGTRLSEAKKLCPDFVQCPARPERYAAVSTAIMAALEDVTPDLEIFSIDEAFLDLTHCQSYWRKSAAELGKMIRQVIYEASGGLLCSVGISGDKTTAKWAAKQNKPNGLTVVAPWLSGDTLASVPVTDLCGINQGIGRFLAERGVVVCGDMAKLPISALGQRFGHPGRRIWLMAQGLDPAPVQQESQAAKTIGHGKVIPPNTRSVSVLRIYLMHMAFKVARRLRKNNLEAQQFSVGLRTELGWLSAKYRTVAPTADGNQIFGLCERLLDEHWRGEGCFQVHVLGLDPRPVGNQVDLFVQDDPKQLRVMQVLDDVNSRYGEFALCPAPLLNRSDMPNVIAPSWRPSGHRESIEY